MVYKLEKLPQAAKNVIETSLAATLSGQDVTPAMIAGAVTKAYVTTEAVSGYFDPSLNDDWDEEQMSSMSDGQIAAITNGILNTANAAFSGGDVPIGGDVEAHGITIIKLQKIKHKKLMMH